MLHIIRHIILIIKIIVFLKVGFCETTYCNLAKNFHHVVFQKCYILFNFVEEHLSILFRRAHSTSRGINALMYSCFQVLVA